MTRAERILLLAVFRWAHREGGLAYGSAYTWTRFGAREQRWGVSFCAKDWEPGETVALEIWRGKETSKDYWVKDIAEAVDVLAALGILSAQFSTAYRAGYDAAGSARRLALSSGRGWSDAGVYALLPWADHELAVRR